MDFSKIETGVCSASLSGRESCLLGRDINLRVYFLGKIRQKWQARACKYLIDMEVAMHKPRDSVPVAGTIL
jgi:hypothetical protein